MMADQVEHVPQARSGSNRDQCAGRVAASADCHLSGEIDWVGKQELASPSRNGWRRSPRYAAAIGALIFGDAPMFVAGPTLAHQ